MPTDIADYRCLLVLKDRQQRVLADRSLDELDRISAGTNFTVLAAFFAGRVSHYPLQEAGAALARARVDLTSATPQQRDALAQECAALYFRVQEVVDGFIAQQAQ